MAEDWRRLGNSAARVLVWAFPPFAIIGQTIRKLTIEKVDAFVGTHQDMLLDQHDCPIAGGG